LTLEIPDSVILADGSLAQVKRVSANVIDGKLAETVYTIERESGAWTEVSREDVRDQIHDTRD
jgi:hypothetical protein